MIRLAGYALALAVVAGAALMAGHAIGTAHEAAALREEEARAYGRTMDEIEGALGERLDARDALRRLLDNYGEPPGGM